ncbi:MAG TPA: rhomboid family intramembrane serine protease [Vicinamibacterales bacterium]|nr:rhomboid family intramembrane serine protease [Vicinamibacterales bacterium]
MPALVAATWTIASASRLAAVRRVTPEVWLAAEERSAARERAEAAEVRAVSATWPVVTLTLVGLIVAVTLIEWWIGTPRAIQVAALVKPAAREGEWWRLFSAAFLHLNLRHLVFNMFALVAVGQLVENFDGRLRVALVYGLSVLGCSVASLWFTRETSLGASGGVLGLASYLVVVAGRRQSQAPDWVRRQMVRMLIPVLCAGLIPYMFIDNAGHAGGFVAGILAGGLVIALGSNASGARALSAAARASAAALVVVAVFTGARLFAHQMPPVRGLDHVPVGVNDLDAAADRFRALGFTLKPGRPHDNGIVNQHAKFADGTELELITAPEARDELTRTYREHLANGDGPAFLALFAPGRTPEVERDERDLPGYIFLGPRNASPTDRPEHFQHANTAESLVAVWLAGDDFSRERELFQRLGATLSEEVRDVPRAERVTVARFAEGEVLMMRAERQMVPGRRVVGVSIRTKSLDFIRQLHIPAMPIVMKNNRIVSAFVQPDRANGLWIEFWAPGA